MLTPMLALGFVVDVATERSDSSSTLLLGERSYLASTQLLGVRMGVRIRIPAPSSDVVAERSDSSSTSLLGERSYLASTQLLGVRIRRQRSCWALLVRALLVVSNLLVDNTDQGVPYSTRRSMYEEVDVRGTHDERVGLLELVSWVGKSTVITDETTARERSAARAAAPPNLETTKRQCSLLRSC